MFPSSTPGILNHPALGPCSYELTQVSDDPDTQVEQVIGMMNSYATQDSKSDVIGADCAACRQTGDPVTDTWDYLARRGGSRGMQFSRDEPLAEPVEDSLPVWQPIVEALIRPADEALLPNPIGDCDDFAMYGAAHLLCSGVPCSFVTIAADPQYPWMYSHVYLVAYPKDGWFAGQRVVLDLSHGHFLGWEHQGAFRLRGWPIRSWSPAFLFGALAGAGAYLIYALGRNS